VRLIFSEIDLEAMPSELKSDILAYVTRLARPKESTEKAITLMGRLQVVALLRESSFHPQGKTLNTLIRRLSHNLDADAPTRAQLAEALPAEAQKDLGRQLAAFNRLASRALEQPEANGLRLWPLRRSPHDARSIEGALAGARTIGRERGIAVGRGRWERGTALASKRWN
jgi:hypothetical protein